MRAGALTFALRRWWWRRFHPLVRIGWITTRTSTTNNPFQTYLGLGLIGVGLITRRRRKERIFSSSLEPGHQYLIAVKHAGKTTNIG